MRFLFFLILFKSLTVAGQQNSIALKVYLEDAYTGKNIKDAKVTLEGFGVSDIVSKYNSKEDFYYFDEIPYQYNTIMAYHKNYNEKGFLYVQGSPGIVKLKLHDPRCVSYDFETPVYTSIDSNYKKMNGYIKKLERKIEIGERDINLPTFKYLYQEDPYHIAIITKMNGAQFLNDTVKKSIKQLSLVISSSIIDPDNRICRCFGINNYYRNLYSDQDIDYADGKIYRGCDNELGWGSPYRVFFLNKQNGQKFSRFNSPEIKQLRELGFTVAALSYLRIEYYGKTDFKPKAFFNTESPFYSEDYIPEIDNYFLANLRRNPFQTTFSNLADDLSARYGGIVYSLSSGDESGIPSVYFAMPVNNKGGIGLGVLDIATAKDLEQTYIFTNTLK